MSGHLDHGGTYADGCEACDLPEDVFPDVSHLQRWNIDEVRRIQERSQAEVIDGTLCDLFSTGAIVAVFEALNADSQRTAQTLPFATFAKFAWGQVR